MKTILVPLDGSALAGQILPYVGLLAPLLSARIHLLGVVSDVEKEQVLAHADVFSFEGAGPLSNHRAREQHILDGLCTNAQRMLNAQAAVLRADGFDVTLEVRTGVPAERIVEVAEGVQGTLIAMATHGYSGLRRWTLGSVADKVVRATSTPLLLVRGMQVPAQAPRLQRILVPLDGSGFARQALPAAIELATCAQATLCLVRAIPPVIEPYIGDELPAGVLDALYNQASQDLTTVAGELRPYQLLVRTQVLDGPAAEVILSAAARNHADLIVMASHGRGGISRWALGSVADKVLHATSTPLLLVRTRNN